MYAPLGHNSYVEYGSGSKVGTTLSSTDSWQNTTNVSVSSGGWFGAGGTVTATFGNEFGGSTTQTKDMLDAFNSSIRFTGPGTDTINHDYDQIYLLLGPRVIATVTHPPDPPAVTWSTDLSRAVPQIVLVGWLKGTLGGVPPDVYTTLNRYGITAADYPQMLQADPFAYDPQGVTTPDPTRFAPSPVFPACPYEPFIGDIFTVSLNNNYTTSTQVTNKVSHSVGLTIDAGFESFIVSKLRSSNTWTWGSESRDTNSVATSDAETFSLGMPSPDYTGPTVLWVYVDKIYKTFMLSFVSPY